MSPPPSQITYQPEDLTAGILRLLRRKADSHCSGEDLADELGVSRVAVWKRITRLRESGYRFEAVRHRGYRLVHEPEALSAVSLLARLDPGTSPLRQLTFFESTQSTNTSASSLLASGAPDPFACLARRQSRGKGRLGRSWHGSATGNLYLSLGFRPNCPPSRIQLLSIWSGLRLCERLRADTGLPVVLKWPNDLWINGRKIAGMLAEATFDADRITSLVFGIGLNVNCTRRDFPADIAATATSLRLAARKKQSAHAIAAAVTEEILHAYSECLDGIDEDRLADAWEACACFLNQPVRLISADGSEQRGVFTGIDRSGALLLRKPDGSLQSFRSGDVSLRR